MLTMTELWLLRVGLDQWPSELKIISMINSSPEILDFQTMYHCSVDNYPSNAHFPETLQGSRVSVTVLKAKPLTWKNNSYRTLTQTIWAVSVI